MTDESEHDTTGRIDRRTALKGAGAGLLGAPALSAPATAKGGGPPGQSCGCEDGAGEFIAKYEFRCLDEECVEDVDEGECDEYECVEWGFALDEGEDIVDVEVTEVKCGAEDEPIAVEFEADGFVVQSVCAYGGRDTDKTEDEEGVRRFETELETNGGQQAAISNLTFCGVKEDDPACGDLEARIRCYDAAARGHPASTNHVIENTGSGSPVDGSVGFVILDSPGEENSVADTIAPGESVEFTADTGLPLRGLVFWEDQCDPDNVDAPLRDDWTTDESVVTAVADSTTDSDTNGSLDDLTQSRLDEVRSVSNFAEFNAMFDTTLFDGEPNVDDLFDIVPADAHVADVDMSAFEVSSVSDWESGAVNIPGCQDA